MIRECRRAAEYHQAALQCLQPGAQPAGHLMHGNKFIKRIKTASSLPRIFFAPRSRFRIALRIKNDHIVYRTINIPSG